jgi:hypothetical protein
MSSAFSAAKPVTRQLSFAVKQRMAIPIDRTEVPNVFKYSDGGAIASSPPPLSSGRPSLCRTCPNGSPTITSSNFTRDNQLARNKGEPILDARKTRRCQRRRSHGEKVGRGGSTR